MKKADVSVEEVLSFWENYRDSVIGHGKNIAISVIIIVIGILIAKGFSGIIIKSTRGKFNIDETVGNLLRKIVRYSILIICAIMILNLYGINTTSLLALLGAASVAIGLGLRDTLGNFIAGIMLIFLGSYRTGEFVEFGAFNGIVKEVNLLTTILETPDGILISAPNSSIWGNPIKNYTRNGKRRMELSVRIAYKDSIEFAFNVLNNIIASENRFLKDPPPQIIVQSFQDSSVNLVIRAWTDVANYWDIYWKQMRVLKEKVEDASLCVPFPQRDVHLVQ